MRELTADQIRASIVNASEAEIERMPLPGLHETVWADREYLGWRDPAGSHRGYIVHWVDDRPVVQADGDRVAGEVAPRKVLLQRDLRQLPAERWPETESLAQQLCMSASTLRRRLAEEGQSYQALKDSVRKELAIVWLAESQISFAEIATRLGFADTSSFYKAFRKWSGSNPGHYRSLILNEAD